jgi:CubicO group peptidase (beta-lactamase class C family)
MERRSGMADPDRGVAMMRYDQFLAASITKMATAIALMTLVEEGRVDLDAGIGRYLPTSVVSGLHEFQGHSYGPEISARQLLSHTSGVADFFGDGEPGPGAHLAVRCKETRGSRQAMASVAIARLHSRTRPCQRQTVPTTTVGLT